MDLLKQYGFVIIGSDKIAYRKLQRLPKKKNFVKAVGI